MPPDCGRRALTCHAPAAPWRTVYYAVLNGVTATLEGIALVTSLTAAPFENQAYRALVRDFDEESISACMAELHTLLFARWLVSPTAVQVIEIQDYLERRDRNGPPGGCADLLACVPRDAAPALREQFRADLAIVPSPTPLDRDGSHRSLVGEVMERTKDRRGGLDLTLSRMSAEIGLSAKYLGQEFHRVAGIRYRDYSRTLRMLHAALLLLAGDAGAPVKHFAYEMGYRDEGDFTRDFSRVFLTSPGAYRKRYRPPCSMELPLAAAQHYS